MFTESLLGASGAERKRKWSSAMLSISVQAALLLVAIIVPMIYTDAITLTSMPPVVYVSAPRVHAASTPPAASHAASSASASSEPTVFTMPHSIPKGIHRDDSGPPQPWNIGPSGTSPFPFSTAGSNPPAVTLDISRPRGPVRISQLDPAQLLSQVQPTYPAVARAMHLQGTVVLHALISREGRIINTEPISGNPILARAAADAVSQWRYRPYILNGEPVEVETQITVNFVMPN
jgi:periplasmic protein TonB